jgi:hypothetical protein
MGICLALFQVDHANLVIRGLPALHRALATGDPSPLRALLLDLPFEESEQLAEYVGQRLAKLRDVGAPSFLIEGEERRLASLRRPDPGALSRSSLEELRLMLGNWCREARSVDLDKAWDLIHWYSDGGRRRRADGDWRTRPPGLHPSTLDYAIHGKEPYPEDETGQPVIRTGGSPEMSWYNPPATVAEVGAAVARVSIEEWDRIDGEIERIPALHRPYLAEIPDRLEYAREAFVRFAEFYQAAAKRSFGVSVEFY